MNDYKRGSVNEKKYKKVLLIDDESSVLFALKLLLQTLDFEVTEFNAAKDALEFLQTQSECDLVLCDIRMPEMDGFTALSEAKHIRPDLPFVLMSGHARGDELQKADELGALGFLAKPFTPEDLKSLLDKN